MHACGLEHLALSPSGHSEPSSHVHVWGLEHLALSPSGHSEPSSQVQSGAGLQSAHGLSSLMLTVFGAVSSPHPAHHIDIASKATHDFEALMFRPPHPEPVMQFIKSAETVQSLWRLCVAAIGCADTPHVRPAIGCADTRWRH